MPISACACRAWGNRCGCVYDDRYVTKEETPPSLQQFIKQRTRWNQGFMQTLRKGTWKGLPTRKQRWLAAYTLAFPYTQAMLGLYFVFALATMFAFKVPVLVALVSYLPVLALLANLLSSEIGLYEFTRAHGLKASPMAAVKLALAWTPYQLVLAYAALRAVRRQMRGINTWEKTKHVGAHRDHSDTMTAEPTEVTRRAA